MKIENVEIMKYTDVCGENVLELYIGHTNYGEKHMMCGLLEKDVTPEILNAIVENSAKEFMETIGKEVFNK